MVATVFLLSICFFLPVSKAAVSEYEKFDQLEVFQSININNTLEYLQEDPVLVVRFLSDIFGNLEPFVKGFFGFNRLKIGALVNETLVAIKNITGTTKLSKKSRKCVADNRKILLMVFKEALSDWQCISGHVVQFFDIVVPLWQTIFDFTVINDEECWFGPFCLLSKGVETARLSAQMVEHSARIMKFAADFILGMRDCQGRIKPFEKISKEILENIKICMISNK